MAPFDLEAFTAATTLYNYAGFLCNRYKHPGSHFGRTN